MSHSEMQDELTCPICMELFRLPRRLPCGHSYCHSCIAAMLSKNAERDRSYLSFSRRLVCPECRDEIYLDFVEGIEAIPLDFKLSKLVELFQFMKKSDDSDSDGISTSARPVKKHKSDTPSTVSTGSSSSSLQSAQTPQTTSQPSAGTSVDTSGEETILGETSGTFASRTDSALHVTGSVSPISCQVRHSLSTNAHTVGEDLEERHSAEPENSSLPSFSEPSNNTERQVENLSIATTSVNPSEQGSNQRRLNEPRAVTVVNEPCEGAVGGVPISEIPQADLSHKISTPQFHRDNDDISSGSPGVRNIQYIASALVPSVTTAIQPPKSASSLAKSASCHSQSDFHTSDLCQSPSQGHVVRSQSLPPEETQDDNHSVARKQNKKGINPEVSTSSKTKRGKKKKGKSWKSLFVSDSSSSDESSSESDDPTPPPRPPAPGIKKGRLVTRFLKSIILSDSSSSDWSDDSSDYENTKRQALKKDAINQVTTVGSTNKSLPDISPQNDAALIGAVGSSAGSETETKREHFSSSGNQNNSITPPVSSSEAAVSQHLTPSVSDLSSAEVTRNLLASTDSNTSPKEVVPVSVRSASVSSETIRKETVPSEITNISTDCSSEVLQEEIVSASDNLPKDLSKFSEKSAERDVHQYTENREESKEREGYMIRDPQVLKLNTFAALANPENISPSHYDNIDTSRHIGMSELDAVAPTNECMNEPVSPLPADPTLYDNINSLGQSPHAARTLYDNISDSDLVRCRLERERALSQGRGQPVPEIENLKTGFEDMDRSMAGTKAEQDISDNRHNYTEEPSSLEGYSPHQPPQRETSVANHLLAGPSASSPPPPQIKTGPSSLYDNVSGTSLTTSQRNAQRGLHQQHSTMPFPDLPNYHPNHFAEQPQTDFPQWQYGSGTPSVLENVPEIPTSVTLSPSTVSADTSANGACGDANRALTQTDSVMTRELSAGCSANDDNNNVNDGGTRHSFEEDDDINDEETDPGARMLQPKRKPRSKLRKFITSLLSLSSSSDEEEQQYYANNTSSSSKSSDW